jgi:hypothetical protein
VVMYLYVYCTLLQVCKPQLRKLESLELTTGMSATVTDYTYTIYIWQRFSFDEECIGPTYVMIVHIHLHE